MAKPRRPLRVWLWILLSLITGAAAVALSIAGILQASSMLAGGQAQTTAFASSPLGIASIAAMAACIAQLVALAAMAAFGVFAVFGVRLAVVLYAVAVFGGFLTAAVQVFLSSPRTYTDAGSLAGLRYNGIPLGGSMWVFTVPVMVLFVVVLALTRPVYRYAIARSGYRARRDQPSA